MESINTNSLSNDNYFQASRKLSELELTPTEYKNINIEMDKT